MACASSRSAETRLDATSSVAATAHGTARAQEREVTDTHATDGWDSLVWRDGPEIPATAVAVLADAGWLPARPPDAVVHHPAAQDSRAVDLKRSSAGFDLSLDAGTRLAATSVAKAESHPALGCQAAGILWALAAMGALALALAAARRFHWIP